MCSGNITRVPRVRGRYYQGWSFLYSWCGGCPTNMSLAPPT